MANIAHRAVTKKEWQIIYEIETKMASDPLYYTFTDKDQFNEFMKNSTVFLITYDGKPVGYCSYEMKIRDLAEINGMAILKPFRGRGLGNYAMNLLLENLKKVKRVMLVTHPENNISLRMYLKFGFVIKEWKENYINNQPRLVLYKDNYR
jgi:ribosomal protein S18 acetylase RimI-like enzyme